MSEYPIDRDARRCVDALIKFRAAAERSGSVTMDKIDNDIIEAFDWLISVTHAAQAFANKWPEYATLAKELREATRECDEIDRECCVMGEAPEI